ncbi:DUF6088 family protein [Parasegetibacter sp. NRK P23]|uniref:DUF6088 family protein n=1 Tax=Parasegetibacter sp. NRK P23 TaxID=2942999 RepID=UPI0020439319|nr:DUF6088 family protein [Parasegetibacter sp. NRK P23]MCM5529448.1 DUF6088 family protein [Parasegetibacter sp. NRK P23]
MSTTAFISKQIEKLPPGQVFSYSTFLKEPDQREATIKALNRMVEAGKLSKLAKGRYYKAEHTVFGKLGPDLYQVVKDLLEDGGKVTGYLTGYSIYNKLGLTTQVSNTIQIGKNDVRSKLKRDRYTISFVRQKNEITTEHIPLLQILDAIRYIREIPDVPVLSSIVRLNTIVNDLSDSDQKKMAALLLKYPAATRALAGAMFEQAGKDALAKKLHQTLNPVTKYKMPGISSIIPNAENWYFK